MWFTIEIQAGNADGTIWQALEPAEPFDGHPFGYTSAAHVGQMVAGHQNLAEGDRWRVAVWFGSDADTNTEPAFVWDAGDEHPYRFSAWLTTDPTCLESEFADVVVLQDKLRPAPDDEEEHWDSIGGALTTLRTGVEAGSDGCDQDRAKAEAEELLVENGWRIEGDWTPVASGFVIDVELANA